MTDIEPVVIDNGSWMCKAGFAGDKTARAYERTVIGDGTVCSGKVQYTLCFRPFFIYRPHFQQLLR